MKFGSASFYKRALSIALPVMAQLLIQNLVSLIDNFMVSGLGDIKMSGVNVAGSVNFVFLVLIGNVLCNGAGIFMSQFKGAEDKNGMQQVFRYKLIVCLIAAVGYTALCAINPAPILRLMVHGNAQAAAIVEQAATYQKVIAWTWIPMVVANPTPEIMPKDAKRAGAYIIATGRSDFENQINNSLAFPGLFKGLLNYGIKRVTEDIQVECAIAIASLVKDDVLNAHNILPNALDGRVVRTIISRL